VCALDYLHNHDVVHRDLKPENILLAGDGHILITDFGLSKMDVTSQEGTSDQGATPAFSMVGTKEYVAPEVILRKPYGKAVDWWAIGILLYELLSGRTPFEGRDGHIFDHIVVGKIQKPRAMPGQVPMPEAAWKLVQGLLAVDPSVRYSARDIRGHTFYTDSLRLDWEALEQKDLPPPIRPQPRVFGKMAPRAPSMVPMQPTFNPEVAAGFRFEADALAPPPEEADEELFVMY